MQRGIAVTPLALRRGAAFQACGALPLLALALAATGLDTPALASPPVAPRLPVIIDTDVGDDIDDAFALTIALGDARLEVLGITTAWGDTRTRVLLVRRLLATLGRTEVPVAQGPTTADVAPFTQKRWALGASDTSAAPDAVEFLRNEIHRRPGELTLLALAPLSNIAALERRDPGALRLLRQVVMMGGSIQAGYNLGGALPVATPSAEYNVASDPEGFATLLRSKVPLRLFPLDSTQLKFDEVRRARLFAYGSPAADALTLLYHQWRLLNAWGQVTPTLFDVVPVVWLLEPASCALTALHLTVDAHGFTRATDGEANAAVCLKLDESAAQDLIMAALAPEPRPGGP
ncbi:MAG: nucleoside hydrolase [Gammaproteobacteria bacterium]|nr:nucleoside hydrolase [Gammaproteobacteria bacterium]